MLGNCLDKLLYQHVMAKPPATLTTLFNNGNDSQLDEVSPLDPSLSNALGHQGACCITGSNGSLEVRLLKCRYPW